MHYTHGYIVHPHTTHAYTIHTTHMHTCCTHTAHVPSHTTPTHTLYTHTHTLHNSGAVSPVNAGRKLTPEQPERSNVKSPPSLGLLLSIQTPNKFGSPRICLHFPSESQGLLPATQGVSGLGDDCPLPSWSHSPLVSSHPAYSPSDALWHLPVSQDPVPRGPSLAFPRDKHRLSAHLLAAGLFIFLGLSS